MSTNNGQTAEIEIQDEEDYTDKRIKKRIMDSRDSLNEIKESLFAGRLLEPDVQISREQAVYAWGDLVRSYIQDLGILLEHPDIPASAKYRDHVDIGSMQIVTPDREDLPFSMVAHEKVSAEELKHELPGFDHNAELPKPREIHFKGLKSIVEYPRVIDETWIVVKNPRQIQPNQDRLTLQTSELVPRDVYEKALVQSDQFLQQAGIGLDIEAKPYDGGNSPGL